MTRQPILPRPSHTYIDRFTHLLILPCGSQLEANEPRQSRFDFFYSSAASVNILGSRKDKSGVSVATSFIGLHWQLER